MTEIRWHGRGGQGAKTAALLLAEVASEAGLHVQGFPEYGPERMGAPVLAYNRVSDQPITLHCHVARPRIVAVLDATLVRRAAGERAGAPGSVTEGLGRGGAIVVNTPASPREMRGQLGLEKRPDLRVATVDASGIAMKALGQAIPNTSMLAAVMKTSGIIDFGRFLQAVEPLLRHKFSRKTALVDGNLQAIKTAYAEVREG
jgi:pyruvate ferredoxin oxidoreductase gamma subunit